MFNDLNTFDPTYSDAPRISNNSYIRQKIYTYLHTQRSHVRCVYRPVQIRVCMVGKYVGREMGYAQRPEVGEYGCGYGYGFGYGVWIWLVCIQRFVCTECI
ncbi:hypothetical protein EON63_23570 [archaeon]|nr:MAG: hypothetical protein EON63_23570 [archaeon]